MHRLHHKFDFAPKKRRLDATGEEFVEAGGITLQIQGISEFRLFVWEPCKHVFGGEKEEDALRLTMGRDLVSAKDMTREVNEGLCLCGRGS